MNCQNKGRWYNTIMETAQIFRPETISRKGERNAWLLTGFALITELILYWRLSRLPLWATFLTLFLLLSAIIITLSNWVDRNTILVLEPDGVKFRNGLRNIQLNWDQIEKVSVVEDRWGKRVLVSGDASQLNFRMLSDIEFRGKVGGQLGFPEGEDILQEIISASGLSLAESNDQDRYYARP
jgi:hypothetical protein